MDIGVKDSVVLVTGGAGGIGQAICKGFAAEGANVVIHYNNSEEDANLLADEIGGIAVRANLCIESETANMFELINSKYGKIDICIANAGYYPREPTPLWEMDIDRWKSTVQNNLNVTVNTAREFLLNAKKSGTGSLVLIGSTAGIYGEAGHSDYAAAKGAITSGLLMSLKNEVATIGNIRVNAVAPGWTITPKKVEQGIDDNTVNLATATMALKKLATPEDVARVCLTLSSDIISGHITGQVIEVAGGMEGRLIYS
ncbi:MAG: oxidoreductase [Euryarchaeota archaeon]|nr:oxidoreductase [Euryarchaeota archaeon]OUV25354.1 MAG: oxidoreductase [Euryarchaeota archaeon TMED97]